MQRLVLIASALIVAIGAAVTDSSAQVHQSPYVNELSSPVRGLSAKEVDDLLNGRGAGYARMAELNNYPGPSHLLELKTQLNLSIEQTQKIQAVFQQMHTESKRLGEAIVEREQQLSTAFADGTITPAELQTQTELLAKLYGQLRATHLAAHVEVTPLLSSEQVAAYNTLRGYTTSNSPTEHHGN